MVKTYTAGKTLSKHFRASEFRCKCGCGTIKTDTDLIHLLERLFSELTLSKINVVSGYRCAKHDKAVGGAGRGSHVDGYAADVICYYKDGTRVPSSVVALTLERMGHKYGIGYRCGRVADERGNIHIDTKPRKWYGDESKSMSATCCTSFFDYLGRFFVTVTDKTGLNVRREPSTGAVIGQYKCGDVVEILRTNPSHTWGLTAKGWICIKKPYVRIGKK